MRWIKQRQGLGFFDPALGNQFRVWGSAVWGIAL